MSYLSTRGTALDAAFGPYRGKRTGESALFRGLHDRLHQRHVPLEHLFLRGVDPDLGPQPRLEPGPEVPGGIDGTADSPWVSARSPANAPVALPRLNAP